jgi:hypothetical protein
MDIVAADSIRAAADRVTRPARTGLDRLLGEADRLRNDLRRRLEDELQQLERIVRLTRSSAAEERFSEPPAVSAARR